MCTCAVSKGHCAAVNTNRLNDLLLQSGHGLIVAMILAIWSASWCKKFAERRQKCALTCALSSDSLLLMARGTNKSTRKWKTSTLWALADICRTYDRETSPLDDHREQHLVAVGVRSDGVMVISRNESARHISKDSHAEARLTRKLDVGAQVLVVRIRPDGRLGLAKPCVSCQNRLRKAGASVVWWSTDRGTFDKMHLSP